MERIYHPYHLWEDYKAGFYNNISGSNKEEMISKVVEYFCDSDLVKTKMQEVINKWIYSFEHNMTNESMNKIAYLGQASVCHYLGIPNTITMSAWSKVPKEKQDKANNIAKIIIDDYFKNKQLCLNFI